MDWSRFTSKTSKKVQRYLYRFNLHKNISRLKFSEFSDPSSVHITCAGATDGGCSQLLRQLSAIAFTRSFGFSYVHTPLSTVQHNVNNDSDWAKKWEDFFQLSLFGDAEKDNSCQFKVVKNLNELIPSIIRKKKQKADQYFQILDCYSYANLNPQAYLSIREKFRQAYHRNGRSADLIYKKDKLNIAIHVRRGDVTRDGTPKRFTSGEKIAATIQRIEKVLESDDYEIYLFSVEKYDDLENLESEKITLIHEMDIFDVLDHLIHADILVSSKSTVGYISAMASKGLIIYEPFWHSPLQGWINMEEDFEQDLKRRLSEVL